MAQFNTHSRTYFLLCLLLATGMVSHAQSWERLGLTPGQPVAYDQDDSLRVLVTDRNVYRSVDAGRTWSRMLAAANAPFLRDSIVTDLFFGSAGFGGFDTESSAVFGDVLFLTVDLLTSVFPRQWYRIYTSRDGGRTLRLAFEDSQLGRPPELGDRWVPSRIDDATFVLVFESSVPTADSMRTHAFISQDTARTWQALASFRQNDVKFAGADARQLALLVGDSLALFARAAPFPQLAARALPGGQASSLRFAERRTDLVTLDTLADPQTVQLWISEDRGIRFRENGPAVALPSVVSSQILGDEAYFVHGPDLDATASSSLTLGDPGRLAPLDYAVSETYDAPFRLSSDGLLLNRYPDPRDGDSLKVGQKLPAAFLSARLSGWPNRSPVAEPAFDVRVLPQVGEAHLRTIGGNVYATADGQTYTLGLKLTGEPRRTRYFDGAVFNRSSTLAIESYYLSYAPTAYTRTERTVVETRDTLLSYRAFEPDRGMYYSVDTGRNFDYLHDGYFWQGGEFAFGDPRAGSIYDFRTYDAEDQPSITRVSRSDDQGQTWRLLDGANFPELQVRDYRYQAFDAILAYDDNFLVHAAERLYYSTDGGVGFDTAQSPGPMLGAEVYRLRNYLYVTTVDEAAYRINLDEWPGGQPGGRVAGAQVDLALAVALDPTEPRPGDTFTITFTLQNVGTLDASGVSLRTSLPGFDEATLRPGFPPSGNFRGTVPAGEVRTVTTYWQRRNGLPIRPWGEIRSHLEPDRDSRPGNGRVGLSLEDDEAAYDPNFADLCTIDTIAPVLLDCPADTTLYTTGDSASFSLALPRFLDECGDDIDVASTLRFGQRVPRGETPVLITATDPAGNVDSCTFTVTVEGTVGLAELRIRTPARVEPNPASVATQPSAIFTAEQAGTYRFELFDALGALSSQETRHYTPGSTRHTLSTPVTAPGTYTLRIHHPGGRQQSVRLVVVR